jgi:hypothetical protein
MALRLIFSSLDPGVPSINLNGRYASWILRPDLRSPPEGPEAAGSTPIGAMPSCYTYGPRPAPFKDPRSCFRLGGMLLAPFQDYLSARLLDISI